MGEAARSALAAMSAWEALAVTLAIVYLVLAIRQNVWCWPAAILSTGIYIGLMYHAGLYMESALQFFYIGVALWGWREWLQGGNGTSLIVSTWSIRNHAWALAMIAILTLISGSLLRQFTDAAFPFADSFTTWGAVITTWMVARKILENWLYWFLIDSVSVVLFVSRELYLTAGLFVLYLVLIIIGYRAWRRSLLQVDG